MRNRHTNPQLPIRRKALEFTLTAGPESRLVVYDRKIQEIALKQRIAEFIAAQVSHERTARPVASPSWLGKAILKHARRKLRAGMQFGQEAIVAAGQEILGFYIQAKHQERVFRKFNDLVYQAS